MKYGISHPTSIEFGGMGGFERAERFVKVVGDKPINEIKLDDGLDTSIGGPTGWQGTASKQRRPIKILGS